MEEDIYYIRLFDIYKGLLTDKQRELFSSHYNFDLSLSEIAESEGVTRQSIYDAVTKVKQKLSEYETALKIFEKNEKLISLAEESDKVTAKRIYDILG